MNFETTYKEVGDVTLDSKNIHNFSKKDNKDYENKERKWLAFINYDNNDIKQEQFF